MPPRKHEQDMQQMELALLDPSNLRKSMVTRYDR